MKHLHKICLAWFIAVCTTAGAQAPVENLVFEGAGIRGIAYCGALYELKERGMLEQVHRVAGTSSGAITACLLSVGYTPEEIEAVIRSTNFAKFNDGGGIFFGGIHRLRRKLGWYKGNAFQRWLEQLIEKRTGNGRITFAELKAKADADPRFRELVAVGLCLNHQETEYFSAETYPNMAVADAIRASMAIPLYYEPMILDSTGLRIPRKQQQPEHHVCVDGGFTDNFPIRIFDHRPFCDADSCLGRTLGIRIDSDAQIHNDRHSRELQDMPVSSLGEFMGAFFYLVKETMNRYALTDADWQRTVSVSDCGVGPKVKKMSDAQNQLLMDAGRKGVIEYFQAHP